LSRKPIAPMPRASNFRQLDVDRLLRAAIKAGIAVTRIEVDPDGKITISAGAGADPVETPEQTLLKAIHVRKNSLRHRPG
jgi:hypothetical protein